ncbi:MAG: hypothetical protein QF718_09350 [Phycisphaerales bacterium]|nr:hypothetical protein [Phycisphaerales bacterium]
MFWFLYTQLPAGDKTESGFHVVLEEDDTFEENDAWQSIFHNTSVDRQDKVRINRQIEIANLIQDIRGIESATVVLSGIGDDQVNITKQQMTACVSITPSDIKFPIETVDSIRRIVSGLAIGILPDHVMVVNNLTGSVFENPNEISKTSKSAVLKEKIEDEIGLAVATVSVHKTSSNLVQIPLRNDEKTKVRVSIPNSWVVKRGNQIGGNSPVLESIKQIVKGVAPNAIVSVQVIEDGPAVGSSIQAEESYAKHAVLIFTLLAILSVGFIVNRRHGASAREEKVSNRGPREEAERILKMDYNIAKQTIDSLDETRKIKVLHEILRTEERVSEIPIVHVSKSEEVEFSKKN